MKIKHSLFSRRVFLNSLLGGWLGAVAASLIYPIFKFVIPPYREPDEVDLLRAEYEDLKPNAVQRFMWGSKPGILKKNLDGTLIAFVGVCTHLDCNVSYIAEKKKFYCACHEGWYDENGNNISGPPPRPLRRLGVSIEGDIIKILKSETVEK
jgi:Rieske Fe-S protein